VPLPGILPIGITPEIPCTMAIRSLKWQVMKQVDLYDTYIGLKLYKEK